MIAVGDYVRRVIVGVDGSMGSLQALRHAVSEARLHDAPLAAVIAFTPPGGEFVDRKAPNPQLRRWWKTEAAQRLRTAFDEALGGIPADLKVDLLAVPCWAGRALVNVADQDGDLLVIGTGNATRLRRLFTRSVSAYCVTHARCRVLAVPAAALTRELEHGLLPRALRHRRAVGALMAS